MKETLTKMDLKINEVHKRNEEMLALILSKLEKQADSTKTNRDHSGNECFRYGRAGHYAQNCRSRVRRTMVQGNKDPDGEEPIRRWAGTRLISRHGIWALLSE
ncbi:hypothetical protein PoB_003705200 [Plakobranchus ocellatus]|uniref:CCHC-type domain-containing protein n=1 Tax=Plakobranchus ocellatus TaxID=259542 RepID=A0AAV4AUD0_9GAST|nr:hypothetical protein PoB_003705200 [Plakobranchus ocellatus]